MPFKPEPIWLQDARENVGLKEISGRQHNPKILRWWTVIRAPFTDDETPWCAGFVGGMLENAGIRSTRSAAARSYENWGVKLAKPVLGCIVVFSRRGGGHVGFFVGQTSTHVLVLGGNQSDSVNISRFPKVGGSLKITGYRWPANEPLPNGDAPKTIEKYEDGGRVTLLGKTDESPAEPTAVVPVEADEATKEEQIEVSAARDNETRTSWLKRKWGAITGWFSGIGGVGVLGYLTDWRVVGIIIGSLFVIAVVFVLFMGPGDVRAWIRKQVA